MTESKPNKSKILSLFNENNNNITNKVEKCVGWQCYLKLLLTFSIVLTLLLFPERHDLFLLISDTRVAS